MGCGKSSPVQENGKPKNKKQQDVLQSSKTLTDDKKSVKYNLDIESCSNSSRHELTKYKTDKKIQHGLIHDKNFTQKEQTNFEQIDAHARKAPQSLRNSVSDLVKYLSSVSKDPKVLVRGIFVWISENIRYDVDGFFGRCEIAPCDFQSVMQSGRSVCEGYATVMEALCREAGIPVKKISGYSKGYGHSADNPFTTAHDTNHAWNAVQLDGKWCLLDNTWGAGHLDNSNQFKKCFQEFYFLTNPAEFIYSHFPYMNGDVTESIKWQLLDNHWDLKKFNEAVTYEPDGFVLGLKTVSHQNGVIEMKNEIEISFKCVGKEDISLSAKLYASNGHEAPRSTMNVPAKDLLKIRVHPPLAGKYTMHIFGKPFSDERLENIPQLLTYIINCKSVGIEHFQFPMEYATTRKEKCVLLEPLSGNLKANKEVKFRLEAPYLKRVMVVQTFLKKNGVTFEGLVKTGSSNESLSLYGSRQDDGMLQALYSFKVI